MPTRILREGIITSEPVNRLSPRAELFYRRLMSVLDDYGRYFAHPSLLRAACYPLQLRMVSEANVKQWLSECTTEGLLVVYNAGKHLVCPNFRQQTRAASKYPEPTENDLLSKCISPAKQMRSESESESESDAKTKANAEPGAVAPSRFQPPGIEEVKLQAAKIGLPEEQVAHFWNHYEANGWRVGRNPMRSWPAALVKWKLNFEKGTYENRGPGQTQPKPQSLFMKEIDRLERGIEDL